MSHQGQPPQGEKLAPVMLQRRSAPHPRRPPWAGPGRLASTSDTRPKSAKTTHTRENK